MKDIKLNEQQIDYLKQVIIYALADWKVDKTTQEIGRQIINKLNEE